TCRDWLSRSAEKVAAAVKEAVCSTSAGKMVCDIIADAAQCYNQAREAMRTASDIPWQLKNAVGALSQWKDGLASVKPQLVKVFGGFKTSVLASLRVCKEWLGRAVVKVGESVCRSNKTCKEVLEALKAEGITLDNWRSR